MRAALCLRALMEPDGDPDRRMDGLMLVAQCFADIHVLRMLFTQSND